MEDKAARFTFLIDPDRKRAFDELCAARDLTPSQVVRQLVEEYLARHGVKTSPGAWRTGKSRRAAR